MPEVSRVTRKSQRRGCVREKPRDIVAAAFPRHGDSTKNFAVWTADPKGGRVNVRGRISRERVRPDLKGLR
jgi:hypothetical protein